MSKFNRIKELTHLLNKYCDAYYNGEGIISDAEYDSLYQELYNLEQETEFRLTSSPTTNIGYKVHDELPKFKHNIPMLSLEKITTTQEIYEFVKWNGAIMSLKEDGLSIRLIYDAISGNLKVAATRGTGDEGSNLTENLCAFTNIPMHINTNGKEFIIDGEAICTFENLERLNKSLEIPYRHPRAVASGSISLLDQNEAKNRKLNFIAWKFTKGSASNSYGERLNELSKLGFDVVPWCKVNKEHIDESIKVLQETAKKLSHPYDGIVISLDDIAYGESLGATSKFPYHSKAYKFAQDAEETIIRKFEFGMGKTGQLTPIACFDSIILDGTEVSRASCHNISYCKNLKLGLGAKVKVIKSMQIIPQIIECVEEGENFKWPDKCPICGSPTAIQKDNDSEILICTNPKCSGQLLGKLTHFVSKKAMNINGLSENTLKLLVDAEFIGNTQSFCDIYHLKNQKSKLILLNGMGQKSVENLLQSIEQSRTVKLENFLVALCIPNIGTSAAKTISKACNGDLNKLIMMWANNFDFTTLDDFGEVTAKSFTDYFDEYINEIEALACEMKFVAPEVKTENNVDLCGKSFCVTGSLNVYKNRDELVKDIESHNGKVVGSVSKKTDYLLTNDADSGSTKARKAAELNIPIINEVEFRHMISID